MPSIADIKSQYPELSGLDDNQVVDAIHQAFYEDLPRDQVAGALGVKPLVVAEIPKPRTMMQTIGDAGVTALKGAIGVPEAAVGMADLLSGGRVGRALENEGGAIGFRPKQAKAMLDDYYSEQQKQAFRNVSDADGVLGTAKAALENPSVIAHAVGESIPMIGMGGLIGRGVMAAAPRVGALGAGAVGEGAVAAGSAGEQIRQQTEDGLLTGKQAALGTATGFATGAFGVLGGKIAQRLGIADVDTMLAAAGKNQAVRKGVVRSVLEGAASEGLLEELPQSVSEQVLQNIALDRPLDDGVDQAIVLGTLSGAAMGGGANALNSFASRGVEAPVPVPPVEPPGPMTKALNTVKPQINNAATEASAESPLSGPSITEPSAQFVDSPIFARILTVQEELQNPAVREKVRARWGEDGLNNIAYYAGVASRGGLPDKTQDNLLSMAERLLSESVLTPIQPTPELGGTRRDPMMLGGSPGQETPAIGMDDTPSGRFTVDSQGRVMPESKVQKNDAQRQAEELRNLGKAETGRRSDAQAQNPMGEHLTQTSMADLLAARQDPLAGSLATRRQAIQDMPSGMAQRRNTDGKELNLKADDPVAGYIEDLRNTNTPAARAYVGEFDAGRVTRADVEQRMQADRGKTADERLAEAAAEGLRMNPKGDPFKTLMAANLAAKTTPGTVIEVPGGYAIRPQESTVANTAAQEVPEADAAPVQADEPAAAVSFTDAADEAGGAAVSGGDEQGAVQALSNVQDAPQAANDTAAEAQAVEAPAPARGDGAAAAGVPDAGASAGVRADGLKQLAEQAKIAQAEAARVGATSQDMDELQLVSEAEDAANERLSGALESIPDDQFGVQAKTSDGRQIILTPSAQKPGHWQLTRFARDGAPWGDSQYTTKKSAILDFLREVDIGTIETAGGTAQPAAKQQPQQDPDQQRRDFMAAEKKRAEKRARLTRAEWEKNPLREFLGRHGVSMDIAKEFAPGTKERRKAMVAGHGPIFRKAGKNIDMLAEAAAEEGFTSGEDADALYELIGKVFRGERVAPLFADGVAASEMEARMKRAQEESAAGFDDFVSQQEEAGDPLASLMDDGYTLSDIEGSGYAQASPELKAEVAALSAQLEAMGVDVESIVERVAQQTIDQTDQEYHEELKQALQQAYAEQQAAQPGSLRNTGEDGRSQTGETESGAGQEGLTAPTKADIEAQQDRAEQAARDKAAADRAAERTAAQEEERKRIAKASEQAADTFELGGDAMANLTGQKDIFGAAEQQDPAPPKATKAAQEFTASDAQAAERQLAQMIGDRIDAMQAQAVQKIGAKFLPTMGIKAPIGKAKIKAAVTDFTKVNPLAAASEFGVEMADSVRAPLLAQFEGRLVDATKPAAPAQQEATQATDDRASTVKESLTTEKPAQEPATDDRDTFTLKRLNRDTNKMEPVTFKRGEYIRHRIGDKDHFGEIDGISQARREFSVDGLWHPMGFANKAERPAAPVRKDMAPLSSVIDKVNAKNGEGLTEADRVPEQKPASKTPTVDRHEALMKSVREGKATAEQFKAAFESLVENKAAVLAELETKTKAELLKAGGYFIQMRYASEKKGEVIDAIYRQMVGNFVLGETLSYGMGKGAFEAAVRRHVEATDDAKLEQYAKDRQAAIAEAQAERAAKAAAMDNPQTLADFKAIIAKHIGEGKSAKEAFLSLTPEQRIQFDTLAAESTREAREARKRERKTEVRAAGQTTGGEIIATKHTRDGYDLFVVKLADRLSREDYTTVLASAKRLGGWYSAFRGNGAIPGFQFKDKANAEAFLKLAGGDTTEAQAQAEQRRDAFEDDRSETAVERLRTMADKLTEQAAEIESADRKTNTARRARFAASALNGAAEMKAKASTMRNIAQAIESGGAKFLDAVRTKSQVDLLTGIVATAKSNELREKYPSYADQEKRRGEPATAETADFAEFPAFTAYRSDLATLGRQLLEVDGTKKLGQRLMSVADDVSDAYLEFAKQPANLFKLSTFSVKLGDEVKAAIFPSREQAETAIKRSGLTGKAIVLAEKRGVNRIIMSPSEAINAGIWTGDGDKRITLSTEFGNELVEAIGRRGNKSNKLTVPWQFQNAYDRRKALSRLGIETASEYRSALREFIGLQERAIANKVREMELQMVGRKADGLDFFPTPAEIADQMIEAADITPDMAVLEPSAGMGHIADRIREAGAEPDVIEISPDRRELLLEKGYHLAETDDFMAMEPRKFFTYGDVFRAPDGTEGVMQGSGGMGSRRVVLKPLIDGVEVDYRRGQWYDRDELTGIGHRGSWSGYDRIIMNPPFSNRRDAEHVMHAYTLLKPGGRIVAIMGEGVFFGQDKKAQEFREWLESVNGTSEKLPAGSFMDPSLPVNTGVSARMVVIDKPAGDVKFSIDDSTGPADTADYGPATRIELTDDQRAAVARLQSVIRRKDGNAGYVLEPVEQVAGAGREFAFARDIIRDAFGIEVTPVKQPGKRIFNGAQVGDQLLLDVNTQKPAMAVMGHELLHQLRRDDPQLYSFLKIQMERVLKDGAADAYAKKLRARYEALGLDALNDDTSMEELLADIVGDQFGQRGFWDILAKKNFRRMVNLARKVLAFFDKVLATGRDKFPFETDKYLADIEAAREIVADVLAEYSGDKVGRGGDGDVKLSAAEKQDQTQTAAFKRWFAGSKVVDAQGRPLVVYHGTRRKFDAFAPMKPRGAFGNPVGVYFSSDKAEAQQFAEDVDGATDEKSRVIEAYLKIESDKDGIIRKRADGTTEYIVFNPEQIKSATGNAGTFDPDNADIRFSVADDIKKAYVDRVPDAVRDRIEDLTTSQRGFNRWWHGTVGTQLHKAKVNKEFGRVYSAVQDFMKDVSRMATLAADQAPDLLPQIDNLADVKKVLPQMGIAGSRQRKADMKAASDALFDGTLRYTRDAYGEPVEAENESDAGLVWTDAELKGRGLNDTAIKLYRQARAAIEQSLENLMAADVYRMLTAATPEALANTPAEHAAIMAKVRKAAASDSPLQVLQIAGRALDQQADVLRKQLATLKKNMDEDYADGMTSAYTLAKDALKKIEDIKARMDEKSERVSQLKAEGYAPLMRFGRYAVDVLDADGNRAFFGLYESQYEANRAARRFAEQGLRVSQSVKSAKEFEMLKGISPETAMLFADLLGVEKDAAMQKWLQTALAEQSALKRHIRRKGIAGFDDDAGRVVAAFLTSNSRAASRALHGLRIQESVENVRAGDVKDEAIKLADYVNNPQEEAQAIRSLLFINYIGGSVASALVNLTQTVVQTFPYLAQYGGARKGASRVTAAMKLAMGKIEDAELADAVKRAEADGVIKPQEVFQLQAEASRTLGSDIRVRAALSLWGSFFQMAEQFNRRVAFIAAYQTAKQEGIRNPFAFAENAVDETQGTFNKGNRPNWSRGAIGATLFTFKTFTIQYVEFLKRLPPKERVLALGVLILLAGFRGLPFAEDAEDIIDTAAQAMGYNFTTKAQMDQFLVSALGQPFADFLQHGASGTGMLPFDVSQRLGMADLLPATGVLKASETRKDDQILEVFGVAGSFVRDTLKGQVAPVAIRNAAKGIEMYDRGIYTDTGGRKVIDVGPVDAAMKAIGLQPAVVADESRKAGSVYEMRALFTKVKGEISEQMALGQFENDPAKVQKARDRLADWNEKNPDAQIRLNGQAIRRRVTEMRKDRSERLLKTTPRELRAQAADALN